MKKLFTFTVLFLISANFISFAINSNTKKGIIAPSQIIAEIAIPATHDLSSSLFINPEQLWDITIASQNPVAGVSMVNTFDYYGIGNGATTYHLYYLDQSTVNLQAPLSAPGGNVFIQFLKDGEPYSNSRTIQFTATSNTIFTARYVTPAILTVKSTNPNSGINITVNPQDLNNMSSGTTTFTRIYLPSTFIQVTAPLVAPNGNTFLHWMIGTTQVNENTTGFIMDASLTINAEYETPPQVATPVINPADGTIFPPDIICTITDATPNAVIHYTTNGIDPTESDPTYTTPITITGTSNITVKSKAFRTGYTPSSIAAVTYLYSQQTVATPVITPADGTTFPPDIICTITDATPNAVIHYTTNGIDPTESDPTYTTPITITGTSNITVKSKAFLVGYIPSNIATVNYYAITVPPILALYTPQNRAFEVSTAPLLTWENITGAAKYWVQVSAFSNFNVLWVNDSSSTIAQLQVLPGILAYNSGYFWRVKARNSAGWGNFQTNPFVFYTKVTWPPYLRQPLNGAVGVSVNPTFDWDDFPGGTKYRIQVSLIPDFSSTLIDDTSSIISQFTVPPEKTLQNNQLYYWRAASKGTTWSDFSDNYSFTTASGNLIPPALIYPQKSDTGIVVTPLIDWSVVSGAERYRLQVSAFYNFSVLWIDTYTTSSEYQVLPGVLAYNSRYYWKVKSLNSGDSSVYSNISNFFTKIYPSPSELSFLKKEKEILIDISWLVDKKTQNYDIEICKDTLFNEPLLILENVSAANTIRVSAKCLQSFSTYFWRIKSYGISGVQYLPIKVFITGLLEENIKANIPSEFNLFQNYPNPFNPATRIKFDIPKNVYVKLEVYDALGSEVIVLLNKELAAGEYEITWNAFNIPSGIYFYRLSAGEYNRAKKMILLK